MFFYPVLHRTSKCSIRTGKHVLFAFLLTCFFIFFYLFVCSNFIITGLLISPSGRTKCFVHSQFLFVNMFGVDRCLRSLMFEKYLLCTKKDINKVYFI